MLALAKVAVTWEPGAALSHSWPYADPSRHPLTRPGRSAIWFAARGDGESARVGRA